MAACRGWVAILVRRSVGRQMARAVLRPGRSTEPAGCREASLTSSRPSRGAVLLLSTSPASLTFAVYSNESEQVSTYAHVDPPDGVRASPAPQASACPEGFPEDPAIAKHIEQQDIVSGMYSFDEILDIGRALFVAKYQRVRRSRSSSRHRHRLQALLGGTRSAPQARDRMRIRVQAATMSRRSAGAAILLPTCSSSHKRWTR